MPTSSFSASRWDEVEVDASSALSYKPYLTCTPEIAREITNC